MEVIKTDKSKESKNIAKKESEHAEQTLEYIKNIVEQLTCKDSQYQEFARQMLDLEINRSVAFWLAEANRINQLQNLKNFNDNEQIKN